MSVGSVVETDRGPTDASNSLCLLVTSSSKPTAPPSAPLASIHQIDQDEDKIITKEEWIAHFAPNSVKAQAKGKPGTKLINLTMLAISFTVSRIFHSAVRYHVEQAALAEGAPYRQFLPDFIIENSEQISALLEFICFFGVYMNPEVIGLILFIGFIIKS